jgi:hypothetical protein
MALPFKVYVLLGVAGPGILDDSKEIKAITLHEGMEALPGRFCTVGDCAYMPTKHLVPIYRGEQARLEKL